MGSLVTRETSRWHTPYRLISKGMRTPSWGLGQIWGKARTLQLDTGQEGTSQARGGGGQRAKQHYLEGPGPQNIPCSIS